MEAFEEPTTTYYRCTKCSAVDSDRGVSGKPPVALVCGSCGAGNGLDLAAMSRQGVGMFPVTDKEAAKIEAERAAATGPEAVTHVSLVEGKPYPLTKGLS